MKSKKIISFLCAAAMTASSFAGLTITASAAAGDKIADVVALQNYNALDTGVLVDGFDTAAKTSDAVAYFNMVTTNRKDTGHYTDKAETEIVTGNVYSVMEKEGDVTDKYIRLGFPMFGDFTKNGRYGHIDFVDDKKAAVTYTADAQKDYVIEFDAKFTSGMAKGVVSTEGSYNPVLRIGTFDMAAKTANAVAIDKAALSIGDDWVHVKSVTSTKGTKVYLDNAEEYAVSSTATTAINAFGLYSTNGDTTISPPADVFNAGLDNEILDADKHTFSPTVDIDNFTIYTVEPEVEADITINYKDEAGNEIKTVTTASGIVGKTFKVSESYKAPIDAEGDNYYKYKSGADDITVAASNNVINLVFESVAKPTVTFNATTGDSKTFIKKIGEAKAMPGTATETIYAQEYVQDEAGKWYQKTAVLGGPRGTYPTYNLTAVAGEADSTVTVDYVPANNVVIFAEAEDTDGATDGTYSANYPALYASGGRWMQTPLAGNYPSGFTTAAVEEAGTYDISINYYNSNGRSAQVFKLAEGADTKNAEEVGKIPADKGLAVHTIENVELAAGDTIWVSKNADDGSKLIEDVDYIVVKDASVPADTDPVVNLTYANKVASLTSDKDRTVKAVLVHTQYSGNALVDVKTHNVDILSGTTPTTVEIEEPVYEGDKFMVWDSLNGMKPLLAAPYTVPAGSGDTKPKFNVTVATGIENGTVTVDKAQAEQGETVTITATPSANFALDTITVTDADSNPVTVTANNTFTMPAKAVTVTATFKTASYTVKGTVDANVTGVTLTDKADSTNVLTAAIADGVATFTNVKAATYTIAATYKAGFEQDAITPAEITVAADNDTAFAITSKASSKPAITGSVAITGTPDVGETLTAAVTGLNNGATAAYVWQSSDTDNGTFTTIANATAETYVVPAEMAGKYIRVVVSTDATSGQIPATAVQIPARYTVTVTTPENGSVTVKNGSDAVTAPVKANTALTIEATPASGYEVGTISVMNGTEAVTVTNGAFTMPAGNVTVTVAFTKMSRMSVVSVDETGNDGTDKTLAQKPAVTTPLRGGSLKVNGGKMAYVNQGWGQTATIIRVNASDLADKIKSAKLTYTGQCTEAADGRKGQVKIARLAEDISDISAITMETLIGKSATYIKDGKNIGTSTADEIDLTADLRSVAGNSVVYVLYTEGKHVEFTDLALDLDASETAIAKVSATTKKVVQGTDPVENVEADSTTEATLWSGDKYTATYQTSLTKTVDNVKYLYTYVGAAGADTITLTDDSAANVVTLPYTKTAYSNVTFTVKVGTTPTADVPVKLNGTPTGGTAIEEQTLTSGADGTVSVELLPGEYSYTVAAGSGYGAKTSNFTVGTTGAATPVAVDLEGVTQVLTTVAIDSSKMNTGILTTTAASKVVGKLSTSQKDAGGIEMATPAAVTWNTGNAGITVAADGTVSITNAVTAGNYTITATAGSVTSEAYTMTVAATGTETVKAGTDDFSGTTNIFGAEVIEKGTGLSAGKAQIYNPYKYGGWGDNRALVVANATAEAAINAVPGNGDTLTVSYREYNGWVGNDETNVVSFENSAGTEILSYTYHVNKCNIIDVKINGATVADFTAFHGQSGYNTSGDANGFDAAKNGNENKGIKYMTAETHNPKVVVTITGQKVKLSYNSPAAKAPDTLVAHDYELELPSDVKADIAKMKITSNISNTERSSGISNLVTTITK